MMRGTYRLPKSGSCITPNHLTTLRVLIAVACPAILIWDRSFAADLVIIFAFTVACVTDWWDGHLARKRSMVTDYGKMVDPIADKILILGLMGTFASFGLYAVEWVVPIAVREGIVTLTRLKRLQSGHVLPAEWAGKIKMGFQIGSVYATLFFMTAFDSGLFYAPEPIVLFVFQSVHYLGIFLALVLTVVSGIIFFNRLES